MRILVLSSRLPYPPNRGDRKRALGVIEQLARDHELVLVSFIEHESERKHASALDPYFAEIHLVRRSKLKSLLSVVLNAWRRAPFQSLYYRSRQAGRIVEAVRREFQPDVVYVHLFRMAQYVEDWDSVYRIIDLTDMISTEMKLSLPYRSFLSRIVYSFESRRVESYEAFCARHFEEAWLISDADRTELENLAPGANGKFVTSSVNLQHIEAAVVDRQTDLIMFVGNMSVFHNIDAARTLAREIMPIVWQKLPSAKLRIIGAEPTAEVLGLGASGSVEIAGYVEDLEAQLRSAAIFVAPLRFAAGLQYKVLEAMAAGLPVITTPAVNRGLGATSGRDLIVSTTVDEIANDVLNLLQDFELRMQLGLNARAFVKNRVSTTAAADRLAEIEKLIATRNLQGVDSTHMER